MRRITRRHRKGEGILEEGFRPMDVVGKEVLPGDFLGLPFSRVFFNSLL